MAIHESGENYLEQILILSTTKEKVRAVDICAALGFSRPTVSVMLRELRENGFVTDAVGGGLALTEKGRAVAERMYERHCLLAEALMALGYDKNTVLSALKGVDTKGADAGALIRLALKKLAR